MKTDGLITKQVREQVNKLNNRWAREHRRIRVQVMLVKTVKGIFPFFSLTDIVRGGVLVQSPDMDSVIGSAQLFN